MEWRRAKCGGGGVKAKGRGVCGMGASTKTGHNRPVCTQTVRGEDVQQCASVVWEGGGRRGEKGSEFGGRGWVSGSAA